MTRSGIESAFRVSKHLDAADAGQAIVHVPMAVVCAHVRESGVVDVRW